MNKEKQLYDYSTAISSKLNNFLDGQDLFANVTIYSNINVVTSLMMIKISFESKKKEVYKSNDFVDRELKKIPNITGKNHSLNYKTGNDIYIIRPNQQKFWSQTVVDTDAKELILEILN